MSPPSTYQVHSNTRHLIVFLISSVLVAIGLAGFIPLVLDGDRKAIVQDVLYFAPLVVGVACYGIAHFGFARRLVTARVTDLAYIEGTTTLRAISAAVLIWVILALTNLTLILTLNVLQSEYPADATSLAKPIVAAVQSILGIAAIIALVGPGFTEYKKAMATNLNLEKHGNDRTRPSASESFVVHSNTRSSRAGDSLPGVTACPVSRKTSMTPPAAGSGLSL